MTMRDHVLEFPARSWDPCLYIIVRTDLESMNPGKGMAQAAHAASELHEMIHRGPTDQTMADMFSDWLEDRLFGVTYTLAVPSERELLAVVEAASSLSDTLAHVVHDPTYPLRDGSATHLLPVNTCGWAFGDKNKLGWYMSRFSLHP